MKILNNMDVFALACKGAKKWGLCVSFNPDDPETFKAMPWFKVNGENMSSWFAGHAVVFFDTRKEMDRTFLLTVGDDGPTELNPYRGKARVYALTCSPEGQLLTENT